MEDEEGSNVVQWSQWDKYGCRVVNPSKNCLASAGHKDTITTTNHRNRMVIKEFYFVRTCGNNSMATVFSVIRQMGSLLKYCLS